MIEILISTLTVVKTESNQKGDGDLKNLSSIYSTYLHEVFPTSAFNRYPVLYALDLYYNIHDGSVRA